MNMMYKRTFLGAVATAAMVLGAAQIALAAQHVPALPVSSDLSSRISTIASTVPPNGDVNPYGVAVVPMSMGSLVQGDVLVSNFNNSQNLQGTGTTIV